MNTDLFKLKPETVWNHFSNICALPHPSKHEQKVREYVVDFAKNNNIECRVDQGGNVILNKPATPGKENWKTITMQAHMDMVPQKNTDKTFDFEKDPIKAYIDGDWVTADGTTLGADNGMGLAAALAVMERNDFEHGALECLFTYDEEAGMSGAFALEPGVLRGDILLNLDSEEEGELYVGCAGGVDVVAEMAFEREPVEEQLKGYQIDIKGLKGGHSGLEIILQRGNSNKIMARLLARLLDLYDIALFELNGGNMRNAIPREATAIIGVGEASAVALEEDFKASFDTYKKELSDVEPDFVMTLTPCDAPVEMIEPYTARTIVSAIHVCPNGVDRMSDSMPGLVETSSNLGIVATKEGCVEVVCLVRSSVDSAKELLKDRIALTFDGIALNCEVHINGGYGGWKPNLNSPILKTMQETYNNLYGKTPAIMAIHAGLECGILGEKYPNMDMISFGPTMRFPHSPDEKVEIASVSKFYDFLVETIKNAPLK